jgi:LacI family transcriptional regulator/LacI family repressor for deo operon, udp, cdd, tsx, nupC, and nupG
MPSTIRDVAKRAGVGLGTVSRVLNGSPQVREDTRQLVLKAIEELDFHPSGIARRLSLGKTLTIAVVAPFFTRSAIVERLRGVEATISGSEYDMVVYNIESPERMQNAFRDLARHMRVDGVLVISLMLAGEDLARFREAGIPVVLIDVPEQGTNGASSIGTGDVQGSQLAVEHLIHLGHEQIAFLGTGHMDHLSSITSRQRFEGYRQAMEQAGLKINQEYVREIEYGRHAARRETGGLLRLPSPPTAIFAVSDTQAIGVLEAAREAELLVPDDLSVVGYNDEAYAEYMNLTTVRAQAFESGQRGVETLFEQLAHPGQPPVHETLKPELVVRSTTGPKKSISAN